MPIICLKLTELYLKKVFFHWILPHVKSTYPTKKASTNESKMNDIIFKKDILFICAYASSRTARM